MIVFVADLHLHYDLFTSHIFLHCFALRECVGVAFLKFVLHGSFEQGWGQSGGHFKYYM